MTDQLTKAELRRERLAARDAMSVDARARACATIAARAFAVEVPQGAVVSGFMPIGSEINPLPLLKALEAQGARLALPVVLGRGRALEMRAWSLGAPLENGVWGIKVPPASSPIVTPDILLVPLAAFDRSGHRIGYGAGYYDVTIAALRAQKRIVAVGLGFAVQEIPLVPATPFDERLDFIMTERETIIADAAESFPRPA